MARPCGPDVEEAWWQKKCKEIVGCTSDPGHSSFIEHEESRVSILKAFDFCDLLSLSHCGKDVPALQGKTDDLHQAMMGQRTAESNGAFLIKKGTNRCRLGFHVFSQRPSTHSGS